MNKRATAKRCDFDFTREADRRRLRTSAQPLRQLHCQVDVRTADALEAITRARSWTNRRAIEVALQIFAAVVTGDAAVVSRSADGSPSGEEWRIEA